MSDRVLLYMMGVVTIIIWLAAPVEAENKPLSERERVLYRKIGKWMMGICFMVAVIAKSIHLYEMCIRDRGQAVQQNQAWPQGQAAPQNQTAVSYTHLWKNK